MALEMLRCAEQMRGILTDRGPDRPTINVNPSVDLLCLFARAKVSSDSDCTLFQDGLSRHVQRAFGGTVPSSRFESQQ